MRTILFYFPLIIILLGFVQVLNEPTLYSTGSLKEGSVVVKGKSTLHDWTLKTNLYKCQGHFHFLDNGELKSLDSLSFSVPVEYLKSGEKTMDKNAYKALDGDRYKYILFQMVSARVAPSKKDHYEINALGSLTIAGFSREIEVKVNCEINHNGKIILEGSENLSMTTFHVIPPTFLMGLMKTNDAFTLEFKLVLENQLK
jgi:polyisoprenoid-binding protein YceI